MPSREVLPIVWTEKALLNAISIKQYLFSNFSFKEIDNFYVLLQTFEITVCTFPELYPKSRIKKNIRRAVVSKFLSAYYQIHKGRIEVLALLDNRCDISKWI